MLNINLDNAIRFQVAGIGSLSYDTVLSIVQFLMHGGECRAPCHHPLLKVHLGFVIVFNVLCIPCRKIN